MRGRALWLGHADEKTLCGADCDGNGGWVDPEMKNDECRMRNEQAFGEIAVVPACAPRSLSSVVNKKFQEIFAPDGKFRFLASYI